LHEVANLSKVDIFTFKDETVSLGVPQVPEGGGNVLIQFAHGFSLLPTQSPYLKNK